MRNIDGTQLMWLVVLSVSVSATAIFLDEVVYKTTDGK